MDLGLYIYRRAIDVTLEQGGRLSSLGRVTVADLSMTTLDVSASLVARLIVVGLSGEAR